jgi:hypothetical protein
LRAISDGEIRRSARLEDLGADRAAVADLAAADASAAAPADALIPPPPPATPNASTNPITVFRFAHEM